MAFKKFDKVFVLSDSTVNVYGFRLRTEGCVMEEVLKNPIGYYNHLKDDGVLVKWADVHVDGDQIKGTPVVNMEHPRGERTMKELEDGFLNAASVGHICLLDHEFEANPADEANPILVGKRWYYKECSLVDSPGNRNAFGAKLYDADGKEINLVDLTDFIKFLNKHSDMKKIELPITPALIEMLSLSDEPTASEVSKGITGLNDRAKKAEKDLADYKDEQTAAEVKDLLDAAEVDKKIFPAQKTNLATAYAGKPKELKSLLDTMTGATVVDRLKKTDTERDGGATAMTPAVKNLVDMGWDKLDKEGKLKDLKDADENAYIELYEKQFGYKPNEKPFKK
jgi:hypothetical protein